jgi:hypothetical protein
MRILSGFTSIRMHLKLPSAAEEREMRKHLRSPTAVDDLVGVAALQGQAKLVRQLPGFEGFDSTPVP